MNGIEDKKDIPTREGDRKALPRPRAYEPPRLQKRRPVSRATLFTGTGPDSGGVVG